MFCLFHQQLIDHARPHSFTLDFAPWMQSGSSQFWNVSIMIKQKVQFVKNKNKSCGARQAGSGHKRLRQIPLLDQGKQEHMLKGSISQELSKVGHGPSTLDDNTAHKHTKYRK